MENLIIKYFQDSKIFSRCPVHLKKMLLCFSDDFTEISLVKEFDFFYLISENVEISHFLNWKINITGMKEESLFELLQLLIIK